MLQHKLLIQGKERACTLNTLISNFLCVVTRLTTNSMRLSVAIASVDNMTSRNLGQGASVLLQILLHEIASLVCYPARASWTTIVPA